MAAERTDLSWQRTGLGILAVAGLLAHRSLVSGRAPLLVAAGVAALAGFAVVGVLAPARFRQGRRRLAAGTGMATPGLVGLATAAVVLVSLVAAAAILTPR